MALAHIERRAERVRKRRDELGLTQEQVADRMQDIHRERHPEADPDRTRGQMVSDWERAVNEPSPAKLELLAAALDWTVAELNADQPKHRPSVDDWATLDGVPRQLAQQLDRIERRLNQIAERLEVPDLPDDESAGADPVADASIDVVRKAEREVRRAQTAERGG